MAIGNIINNEDGDDVRDKLNLSINQLNTYTVGDAVVSAVSPDGTIPSLTTGRDDNSSYWVLTHAGDDYRLSNPDGTGFNILLGVDKSSIDILNSVGIGDATPEGRLTVKGLGSTFSTKTAIFKNSSEIDILIIRDDKRVSMTGNVGIGGLATTTSVLNVTGLPTSSAGLATGDVWNDSGVLTIV